jgi:hypothetical protein
MAAPLAMATTNPRLESFSCAIVRSPAPEEPESKAIDVTLYLVRSDPIAVIISPNAKCWACVTPIVVPAQLMLLLH